MLSTEEADEGGGGEANSFNGFSDRNNSNSHGGDMYGGEGHGGEEGSSLPRLPLSLTRPSVFVTNPYDDDDDGDGDGDGDGDSDGDCVSDGDGDGDAGTGGHRSNRSNRSKHRSNRRSKCPTKCVSVPIPMIVASACGLTHRPDDLRKERGRVYRPPRWTEAAVRRRVFEICSVERERNMCTH